MKSAWRISPVCCGGLLLAAVPACIPVDAGPDFARTAEMVSARTRADEVYNPDAEAAIESRVSALLEGDLTVDEAVSVALLNNRSFQAMFQQIGASRSDVVQSRLLSNPSLSLLVRFPEGGGRSNLTLGLGQELVDLWQIPVRREIAEANLEQTVLTIAARAVELAGEVKRACYAVLALERAEEIAESSRDLAERSLRLAKDRFDAGEINLVDVDLARADLLAVRRELATLRRDRAVARATLGRLLGLSRWGVAWMLADELPPSPAIGEDEELVLWAMRQRLDARAAAQQVRAAEREVQREYLKVFPSVVVGVEGERTESRAIPGRDIAADAVRDSLRSGQLAAPTIQSKGERRAERSQIIDLLLGPSLDITLPVWDQNQAQIARSRFVAEQQRKQYEDLLDVVAQEVQQAAASLRGNDRLTRLSEEEILPQARKSIENARRAYQTGQNSIVTLMDAQRFLIDQRRNYVADLRNRATALADLEQAVGGTLPKMAGDEGLEETPASTQPDQGERDGQ